MTRQGERTTTGLAALDGRPVTLRGLEREVVEALLRGGDPATVGWAVDASPERVLAIARDALVGAGGPLAEAVDPDDLLRVVDYLLRRQSPGLAAGTVEIMGRSAPARAFAVAVRDAIAELYPDAPPPVPSEDPVAERRRANSDADGTRARVQAAAREAMEQMSPFRDEAVQAYREGKAEVKLPRFTSPLLVGVLYGLVALMIVLVAACVLYKVPIYGSGTGIVTRPPNGLPRSLSGPVVVAVFAPRDQGAVRRGEELRVALPGAKDRVSLRVAYTEPRVLSADDIRRRYGLRGAGAASVTGPGAVAVAELRRPAGGRAETDYDGAVANVDAQVGRKRVVQLISGGSDRETQ